jgi:hypothetical protein
MSLVVSIIFGVFGVVAVAVSIVIAVYLVLGLLFVLNLYQSDSEFKALQLQVQFLENGVTLPSEPILQNTVSLDNPCHLQGESLHLV